MPNEQKPAGIDPGYVRDLFGLAGAGLMAYGGWLIAPAVGFIIGGASVYLLVVIASLRAR